MVDLLKIEVFRNFLLDQFLNIDAKDAFAFACREDIKNVRRALINDVEMLV